MVLVEYVGINKVGVHSRGTNNGYCGCCRSGKLWKVKWWSSGEGVQRNGGSRNQGVMMMSRIFFVVIPGSGPRTAEKDEVDMVVETQWWFVERMWRKVWFEQSA